jgi:catechol 2,3-dioxygenase-like lactoylglutathione lyase family enzyme
MAFVTAPTGEEIEFWYISKNGKTSDPVNSNNYIKSFVHVALTVPDMDAASKFYEGLGIIPRDNWGWGCSMHINGGRELELFTGGQYSDNKNGIIHIGFWCDDADASFNRAKELGGETHGLSNWENLRMGFVRGLAGELIEFVSIIPDKKPNGLFDSYPDVLPDLFV